MRGGGPALFLSDSRSSSVDRMAATFASICASVSTGRSALRPARARPDAVRGPQASGTSTPARVGSLASASRAVTQSPRWQPVLDAPRDGAADARWSSPACAGGAPPHPRGRRRGRSRRRAARPACARSAGTRSARPGPAGGPDAGCPRWGRSRSTPARPPRRRPLLQPPSPARCRLSERSCPAQALQGARLPGLESAPSPAAAAGLARPARVRQAGGLHGCDTRFDGLAGSGCTASGPAAAAAASSPSPPATSCSRPRSRSSAMTSPRPPSRPPGEAG